MKNSAVYLCILFSVALLLSCKPAASDDPAPVVETGKVSVKFDNRFKQIPGGTTYEALEFNTKTYDKSGSEQYTISMFKYYISNVKLKKSDGSYYEVPESYFLIDASGASTTVPALLNNIPVGDYTGISYVIGVDAAKLQDGVQSGTGALSTTNGMFWSWNSGYIFLKLEGTSPQSTATNNKIQYHIGGYKDPNNALQTVEQDFGATLRVTKVGTPSVHIMVEASKVIENITIASTNAIHMPGSAAIGVAQNYKTMFRVDHIHN